MQRPLGEASIRALLGPTNTGKTHRAIERMLEHDSGMIGLPLRLLAREVYDRVTARVGEGAVALVTGEEKRVPVRPRYWICTVEAMPLAGRATREGGDGQAVDFLAVDEVQLATHRQRGHVFTDRMLHARGEVETWFLGSATMRDLVGRLCPTAVFESRPRLSTLSDAGSVTLATLPPRSVVVAFSATRVYELAEKLRLKRGGAAVVIGALSPRARNAQVALFQSGEVDTLVATDAIGMGLNLDVDNVVFAELRKFDGRASRALEDNELAQIAGRAGRHHRAGRFATLDPLPPLPLSTVRALEQHRFAADERVFWRNHELDFGSVDDLLTSLRKRPFAPWLRLADDAEDMRALFALSHRPTIAALARGRDRVALLWEVCQIPDFRQLPFDDHFNLQAAIFTALCDRAGKIPRGFIEEQLARLQTTEGDLETLLDRMSAVRTWTYITGKGSWVDDAGGWQARTHALEDRLSDALHERLVQRFVDTKAKRRGRAKPVEPAGARSLAGELAAKAQALGLVAPGAQSDRGQGDQRSARWLESVIEAPHERFRLEADARIFVEGKLVARLIRGADRWRPEIALGGEADTAGGGVRLRLGRRLLAFARDLVAELRAPIDVVAAASEDAAVRGIVYQVAQSLGSVAAATIEGQQRDLPPRDRRRLIDAGLVLGRQAIFVPALFTPDALRVRRALCTAELWPALDPPAPMGDPGIEMVVPLLPEIPPRIYPALGFLPAGPNLAVRADELEAIAAEIARGASLQSVAVRLGLPPEDVSDVVSSLRSDPTRGAQRRRHRS